MKTNTNSINDKGVTRKLIYNESILLINRNDELIIDLEHLQWKLVFVFSDNLPPDANLTGRFQEKMLIEGKTINIILYGWNSETWIQSTEPRIIPAKEGKMKILFHYRTTSSSIYNWRTFEISVWQEEEL